MKKALDMRQAQLEAEIKESRQSLIEVASNPLASMASVAVLVDRIIDLESRWQEIHRLRYLIRD